MPSRVIYMGTPEFAVPALKRLVANDLCEIALVVTQPDRPAGRGKKLVAPPVKMAADQLSIPSLQTPTLRDPRVRQQIVDLKPDLIVVAAFGMILGKWILELPTRGCVNLHASLLPKYRGANPIASAIAEGESVTGVSLMRMDRGLDTGPVYANATVPITDHDTTESLTPRLADAAGELLDQHLVELLRGTLRADAQGEGATLTRMMSKADGWLDYSLPAVVLERHVRAMWPWPRAWTIDSARTRIQVHAVDVIDEPVAGPGEVVHDGKDVIVGTGEKSLVLRRIQLPGGKPIEGPAIAQAQAFAMGTVLGTIDRPEIVSPLVRPVED